MHTSQHRVSLKILSSMITIILPNRVKSNPTGVTGAYPLLAGDGTVPDHEVRGPVG